MNKIKKIPMRKCVVTNERVEKKQLLRIVKTPEGNVIVDLTGKANGRGAYLTRSKAVILQAKKTKVLERHLEIAIPESIYDQCLELMKNDDN